MEDFGRSPSMVRQRLAALKDSQGRRCLAGVSPSLLKYCRRLEAAFLRCCKVVEALWVDKGLPRSH